MSATAGKRQTPLWIHGNFCPLYGLTLFFKLSKFTGMSRIHVDHNVLNYCNLSADTSVNMNTLYEIIFHN